MAAFSLLPNNWASVLLREITNINPSLNKSGIDGELEVSFVPMSALEAGTGKIDVSQIRKFAEVNKGYTAFQKGDILFSKITPCMENGKIATVPELHNYLGFGSTEFHVLRPHSEIEPKFLYYFVSSQAFRNNAERNMTGAVGQRRVPKKYLEEHFIPLPPLNEQKRIVAKIEELFSKLDKGIESLKSARARLNVYRQAVLKYAFEGKLTAKWREENKDKLENADQLLKRIKKEREAYYQRQLEDWKSAIKAWQQNNK